MLFRCSESGLYNQGYVVCLITKYVRLPDLLTDLKIARDNGTYRKVMGRYSNPTLLILGEWLLLKPDEQEQKDIFELLRCRRKKSSTIFCSQYEQASWYDQLGGDEAHLMMQSWTASNMMHRR